MKTVAATIKTAAIAAAVVFGVAGTAAAQGAGPFVNSGVPEPAPPHSNPNTGNPYYNQHRPNPHGTRRVSADRRLARFLVGTWQGRLRNGRRYRIRFARNGRVVLAPRGSDIAAVGRYTVTHGRVRFRLTARCSISTKRCRRLDRTKVATIVFRPVDRHTLRVGNSYMRRVG